MAAWGIVIYVKVKVSMQEIIYTSLEQGAVLLNAT